MNKRLLLKTGITKRWDSLLDAYIDMIELSCVFVSRTNCKIHSTFINSNLIQPTSNTIFKVTVTGLCITGIIFILSCQTTPNQAKSKKQVVSEPHAVLEKKQDPFVLYRKNDDKIIEKKSNSSQTGSIYADSKNKKSLIKDEFPQEVGEFITVIIDPDLLFKPDKVSKTDPLGKRAESKSSQTAKTKSPEDSDPQKAFDDILLRDLELENQTERKENISSLKMEIIGSDENFLFLRNKSEYDVSNRDKQNFVALAKVPKKEVLSSTINASQVVELEITNNLRNNITRFHHQGWTTEASRLISGYRPETQSNFRELNDFQEELKQKQANLKSQARALAMERERIRKERKNTEELANRNGDTPKKPTTSNNANTGAPMQSKETTGGPQPNLTPGATSSPNL